MIYNLSNPCTIKHEHYFRWDNVITPTVITPTLNTPTGITPTLIHLLLRQSLLRLLAIQMQYRTAHLT